MSATKSFYALVALVALVFSAQPARAQQPEIWLSVRPSAPDFHLLYDQPDTWANAARNVAGYSIDAAFIMHGDRGAITKLLAVLKSRGIPLAVSLSAVTTDKHICGAGMEGMIWPGEAGLLARRLQSLGADVAYFSFDLPLTAGHVAKGPTACHFSIRETAHRLLRSVRELRAVYPNVKFNDAEVPTGKPISQWIPMLSEWLDAYQQETGENLNEVALDVWWEFPWQETVRQSVSVLHKHGVRVGTFVDSDNRTAPPAAWVAAAKVNICRVRALQPTVDFVVVANWLNPTVKDLPEFDPTALTSLVNWYAAGPPC